MKKTLLAGMLIISSIMSAQVDFAGNPEYGRIQNFVYDKTTQNKIYATTKYDKHILVSNDNGVTWNVLYNLPYSTQSPSIQQMRLINNGTALSFIEEFGSFGLKISILDLQSLTIIKQYDLPQGETAGIADYSIANNGNMDTAIIILKSDDVYNYNKKLFYTANSGTTWSNIYDSGQLVLSDAKFDPQNPQTLFITQGTGPGNNIGGFSKSTDSGATWTETLSGIALESLDIDSQDSNIIYTSTAHFVPNTTPGMHQAVYKSVDGGSTWTEQSGIDWSEADPLLRGIKMIVDPSNSDHVLALGATKIAVSSDAGNSWTSTFHNGLVDGESYFYGSGAAFNPFNPNEVIIANERYPKRSVNGGITLTSVPNPFYTNMGKAYILKDSNNVDQLIYGVQYGYTVRDLNTNQETPTTVYPLSTFPFGQQIAPFFVDKNIQGRAYIFDNAFFPSIIKLSNDYGATTTNLLESYDNTLTATETDPSNPNIVWIATYNGSTPLTKIDFTDTSNPVVDNTNFPAYPYDYAISGIKINKTNPNIVMVTIGNSVFTTVDGGNTWNETTIPGLNLPDYIADFTQNPLNAAQYTLATSNGIYTSTDSGNTWTKLYNGIITKVTHSSIQNGQIIGIANTTANTPSKVVYSNDYGITWQEKNASDYFNTTVLDGAVRFLNSTTAEVYLTTDALGILKDVITFSTLGISEPGLVKDDISIYPNPAQEVIHIKFSKNVSKFKTAIYNTAGQLILTSENQTSINISGFAKGIYLLKIEQENSRTIIKKIIKE